MLFLVKPEKPLEFPSGAVAIDSSLYVERPPIESKTCHHILQPGSVLRIKAPRRMGKSSLLLRIISFARQNGYKTVKIDFQEADEKIYSNTDRFLRWFCANVARQLGLKPNLNEFWDEDMGSKVSCTMYFEGYLLEKIPRPIVLALNEVNRVFEYPAIAKEFLPLLRFWHETAKQTEAFQKLRLVVVHSTEIYVPLDINQSPFNVGLPIKLPEFNLQQVIELARRHQLNWENSAAEQLTSLVGGHPYLVRLALYHLAEAKTNLEQLLAQGPTQAGIYSNLLRKHWEILQKQPELAKAIKLVAKSSQSLQLEPIAAYKLNSMGLVNLEGDRAKISCQLYRLYFSQQQTASNFVTKNNRIEQLERENRQLKDLIYLDSLTQIPNRRYFDESLVKEWRRMARFDRNLSLILLDVDHFKLYNDTYGHQAGDICLRSVAGAIDRCLKRGADLAARYGGEEFAVILPGTDLQGAVFLAEQIRNKIKSLEIEHARSSVNLKVVTVSIGVTSIVPNADISPTILVQVADKALYKSKRNGRDRISQINISF